MAFLTSSPFDSLVELEHMLSASPGRPSGAGSDPDTFVLVETESDPLAFLAAFAAHELADAQCCELAGGDVPGDFGGACAVCLGSADTDTATMGDFIY